MIKNNMERVNSSVVVLSKSLANRYVKFLEHYSTSKKSTVIANILCTFEEEEAVKLVKAYVNQEYEVERTPEEIIRTHYNDPYLNGVYNKAYLADKQNLIKNILNVLDVSIEGINAFKPAEVKDNK